MYQISRIDLFKNIWSDLFVERITKDEVMQGSFCECTQPMRDGVTLKHNWLAAFTKWSLIMTWEHCPHYRFCVHGIHYAVHYLLIWSSFLRKNWVSGSWEETPPCSCDFEAMNYVYLSLKSFSQVCYCNGELCIFNHKSAFVMGNYAFSTI